MSMFGNKDIPPETLEHILDFLHDDGLALRASALVQRSWVATTRRHLFNEEVICQGRTPRRQPIDNATTFVELCRSPLCTILGFVQTAIVMISDPSLDEAVIDVLDTASNLKKVVYLDNHEGGKSARWLSGTLSQLQDFVYSAQRGWGDDTADMISTFADVRSLAVYSFDFIDPWFPRGAGASPNTFSNLRSLRLQICNHEDMFRWLLDSFTSIRLESLELQNFSQYHRGWGPVRMLNAFLASQANTLTNLALSTKLCKDGEQQFLSDTDTDVIVNLAPLSHLTRLALRTHDLRTVQASLATLSSSSLQELRVEYRRWYVGISGCDCDAMREARKLLEATREDGMLSNASLHFGATESLGHQVVMDAFRDFLEDRRIAFFESSGRDNFQPDTFDALALRIVQRTPPVVSPDSD